MSRRSMSPGYHGRSAKRSSIAARFKCFGSVDYPTCTRPTLPRAAWSCSPCRYRWESAIGSRPVYFSDVVVRRDSTCRSFRDLRGATWAYNEPRSHSGFNVVRAHLFDLGEARWHFFAAAVEAGAHTKSLQMILSGAVDGAAIDSTVLEWLGGQRNDLADEIRVIDTLGPSPIPPWVISRQVAASQRRALRQLLGAMHLDPAGREILADGRLLRFTAADDHDYDPIRAMAHKAERVSLV